MEERHEFPIMRSFYTHVANSAQRINNHSYEWYEALSTILLCCYVSISHYNLPVFRETSSRKFKWVCV